MRYLIAIILPFLAVMLCGRIITGLVLLACQFTFIGWIPAAIVALIIVSNRKADKRVAKQTRKLTAAIRQGGR